MPLSLGRRTWLTAGVVVLSAAGIVTHALDPQPAQPPGHGRESAVGTVRPADRGAAARCTGLPQQGTGRYSAALPARNKHAPKHARAASDYNGDGISDLAAGTPKASGGAGSVTVVPGSPHGPSAEARLTLTQNSPGGPGSSEPGDHFGAATAWGDVNGDGCTDLVVGAPGKDGISGRADRGLVTVLYGPGLDSGFSYTTSGVPAAGARLGSAVTVGDFNGDGTADVFAAGTGNGGTWNVRLTGGSTRNLRPAAGVTTSGTLTGATGPVAQLDATSGDFNRDGFADVALNYRDTGGTGRVVWFAGSASGLTRAGILAVRGGRSVAAGDFSGNGYDDLVIGQPYASESGGRTGGQITVVPGTAAGLAGSGAKVIHQDGVGVASTDRPGDAFGASVSTGDYNADGYADALVGAPGEDLTSDGVKRTDAGQATLFQGSASGLTTSGSFTLNQDTPGILDSIEKDDHFGSSVSLTDLSGSGHAGLVFGAEGEDAGDGLLLYTPITSTGFGLAQTVSLRGTALSTPAGARLGEVLAP
ncbi:FG-GAP-like repeat-containing protein [Streptomyces sp. NPDC047009]|uniref:FG-GAP-like repeat-containing protein n=1 Tax=Streptomyces sp. NPDC047009 TaxID=3154496 RepID=UPI0033E1FCBB